MNKQQQQNKNEQETTPWLSQYPNSIGQEIPRVLSWGERWVIT